MPSEDRLRHDEERSPELSGYESGQESDEGTVGPGEAGTGDLGAEHSQLVAQNKGLCILGRSIRPVGANDLEHTSGQTVEKGQGHDGSLTEGVLAGQTIGGFLDPSSSPDRSCMVKPRITSWTLQLVLSDPHRGVRRLTGPVDDAQQPGTLSQGYAAGSCWVTQWMPPPPSAKVSILSCST